MLKDFFREITSGRWVTTGLDVQWRLRNGVLSFQQTVSKVDWFHNFAVWIAPYKNMPVKWYAHAGFVKMWKSAEDEILKACNKEPPTIIAGFSQGAALATLAHESIGYKLGIKPTTLCFGGPKVLWMPPKIIQERFNGLVRYEMHGDPVPYLPPWLFGYRHVGKVNMLGKPTILSVDHHRPQTYEANL